MTPTAQVGVRECDWEAGPHDVLLGIDLVELVSSSMYVDPLAIYREYVQNAADAIDDARALGVLDRSTRGRIDISIDAPTRAVRVRDNGAGVRGSEFLRRLTAFGASEKRGGQRRGFRGVGRLAALGYCQELVFRSRTSRDEAVRELRWDCRILRALLRSREFRGTLGEAVRQATAHRAWRAPGAPDRFFEVELCGVVRHGRDHLLNESAVREYLGQVAPVPFAQSFPYRERIEAFLGDCLGPTDLDIFVNGAGPVQRPHTETILLRTGASSRVSDIAFVSIPGVNGDVAAKGWILHHEYLGAVPRDLGVRGLRLRSGNMQVGDETSLDATFIEPRFNAWSIGEFHILDSRIVPNGRRDQYEQGVHLANVLNQIGPLARDVVSRCRSQSEYRQRIKKARLLASKVEDGLAVLRQGVVSPVARRKVATDLDNALERLRKAGQSPSLSVGDRREITRQYATLHRRVARAVDRARAAPSLRRLTPSRRRAYEEVFSMIYDCAADVRGAKDLVDRVLGRLQRKSPKA